MITDQPLIPTQSFPQDTKIRISITGLAFCELSTTPSQVYFLRHLANHKLKMTIATRERGGGKPEILGPYLIDVNDALSVQNDSPDRPMSYVSVPYAGEYELSRVINMKSLHKNGRLRYPTAGVPLTRLSLYDCAFSTMKLTRYRFKLIEHFDGVEKPYDDKFKTFGDILVGKIKGSSDSITKVVSKVFEDGEIHLPSRDGGADLIHDIIFSNVCDPDEDTCVEEPDFKHYYSVFSEDSGKPGRYFSMQPETDKGPDVSACNPVFVEPPGG